MSMPTPPIDTGHIEEGHLHPAHHLLGAFGAFFSAVLIVGSFLFSGVFLKQLIQTNQLAAVITATLVDLANGDRQEEALNALTVNPLLVAAAQAKANDMAAKGYFAHVSPDGRDSWSWFRDAGYLFTYAGENLAVDFSDSEDVERAWMNSPTHRANILNGHFTEIGIATAEGEYKGRHTIFVVQMFGSPAHPLASAQPTPVQVTEPAAPEEIAVATTEPAPISIVPTEAAPAPAVEAGTVAAESAEGIANNASPHYASLFDFFAASPESLLRTIYTIGALILVLALILVTELEVKKHHMKHVAAAVLLIALMGSLLFVADRIIFAGVEIGEQAASVLLVQ